MTKEEIEERLAKATKKAQEELHDRGRRYIIGDTKGTYAIYPDGKMVFTPYGNNVELINIEKEWSFSGRDIFVLPDEKSYLDVFKIQGERAVFYDWDGNQYTLDITGKEIK